MAAGDVTTVEACTDLHYVDTGMYDTAGYGAVYVLDTPRPAVIDTGIGTHHDRVLDALAELDVEPELILPTHVHLDHAGGAGFLAEAFPDAEVRVHEVGLPHLVDPERLVAGTEAAVGEQWAYYVEPEPVPEDQIAPLTDGDELDLGDRTLTVHHAPGHAPHQVVFHDDRDDAVFTADAVGIYVPAVDAVRQTSPPSQFDLDQALADVDTVAELEPETLCFPHFGPREATDAVLSGYKRTLVEWVEAVRRARSEEPDDDAVIERFADAVDADLVEVWGAEKARAEERLNTRGVLGYLDATADDGEDAGDANGE
ncbi:MBL fold metallo-hydrolase [Halobaculum sp. MBLA0147]|uniref:MBL fold metallo-hydrolase n=1 Tax=Halobaculum sp. MBLA0147 TaxID=3079934 RepID=UPI0035261A4E